MRRIVHSLRVFLFMMIILPVFSVTLANAGGTEEFVEKLIKQTEQECGSNRRCHWWFQEISKLGTWCKATPENREFCRIIAKLPVEGLLWPQEGYRCPVLRNCAGVCYIPELSAAMNIYGCGEGINDIQAEWWSALSMEISRLITTQKRAIKYSGNMAFLFLEWVSRAVYLTHLSMLHAPSLALGFVPRGTRVGVIPGKADDWPTDMYASGLSLVYHLLHPDPHLEVKLPGRDASRFLSFLISAYLDTLSCDGNICPDSRIFRLIR